jgi:hypothetical protein
MAGGVFRGGDGVVGGMGTGSGNGERVVPRALLGREVLAVFVLLLIGASVDAGALPGQLLAVPSYLVTMAVDLVDDTVLPLGGAFYAVVVVAYYVVAVLVGGLYRAVTGVE